MKLLMTLICALLVTCPARADDVSDAKEIFLTLLNNQKSDNNRFDSYLSPDCTLRWTETNKLKATTVVFDDAYMVSELTKRMIYGKHNVPEASISCSFEEKLVRVTWTTQSSPEKKSIYSMLFRHDEGGGIKIKEVVCIVPTSNVSDTNNVQLQTISVFDSGSMGIYSRHPFLRSIASFKSLNRILADGYADELSDDDKHDGELVSKLQGRDEHIIHTLAELKIGEIVIPTSATAFDCSSSTTNFKTYRLSIPYAIKPNNDPNLLKTITRLKISISINAAESSRVNICDLLPNTQFMKANYSADVTAQANATVAADGKFGLALPGSQLQTTEHADANVKASFRWTWTPKDLIVDSGYAGNTAWINMYSKKDGTFVVGQVPIEISFIAPTNLKELKLKILNEIVTTSNIYNGSGQDEADMTVNLSPP